MKKNKSLYCLLIFIVSIFTCTLQSVANDTIVMISQEKNWQYFYIKATVGEQFKINFSNTSSPKYYIGTGEYLSIEHNNNNINGNNITYTIVAMSENCKITGFLRLSRFISYDFSRCPSIVSINIAGSSSTSSVTTNLNVRNCINLEVLHCGRNPLYNLDISDCKALKILVCPDNNLSNLVLYDSIMLDGFGVNNNHLSLSNLYAILLQTHPPANGYFCCQTLPQINVEIGEPVDFSSEHEFDGILTNYWISRDGQPISYDDFTFNDGIFTFHYFGNYLVVRINYAIIATDVASVYNPILVMSNSSDATLTSLKVSNCSNIQFGLNPEYKWNIYSYEVDVPYSMSSVCINAIPSFNDATVNGNGNFLIELGENIFLITVTSADGISELEYTIIVNRVAPNTDATLSSLKVSSGELTPEFNNDIYDYTVELPYNISTIGIYATTNYPYAGMSGTGWQSVAVGVNTFIIRVTAEDGITKIDHTVTVIRAAPNTDATLLNLAISEGELTPEFNSIIHDYTVDVEFSINSINITATTNDPKASISGTGEKQLAIGENIYTITVTAEDKVTKIDYKITVTRADDVGILENSLAAIDVYPNPTTGELRITNYELRIEKIEIVDIAGKKLLSFESLTPPETTFNISHLQVGIYFVKIATEAGKVMKKIVKQ